MAVEFTGQAARRIVETLAAAYPSVADLEPMVNYVLGRRLNEFANPAQVIHNVVYELCSNAFNGGELDALLQGATLERPGNEPMRSLHLELFGSLPQPAAAAPAAPQEPEAPVEEEVHERCVLGDDVVFVDREPLRTFMRNIHEWSTKRLVVVTGGRKSGKSYSAELIRYGSKKLGYDTVTVPLGSLSRDEPIKALAQAVVGPMQPMALSGGMPEQGRESSARWLHHPLMGWMVGWMKRAEGIWWIVFDEFDHEVLHRDVYDFLADLGEKVENDLPRCRLALLGYDRAIPEQWHNKVRHETIGSLERRHLVSFFEKLYAENGLPPHQGTVDFLADDLFEEFSARLQQFSTTDADRLLDEDPKAVPMRYLNSKLKHLLSRIQDGGPL